MIHLLRNFFSVLMKVTEETCCETIFKVLKPSPFYSTAELERKRRSTEVTKESASPETYLYLKLNPS